MFASFKLLFVYVTFGTVVGMFGVPYSMVVGNVKQLYRVSMWILRTGLRAAGVRVEISGLEHVPRGQTCIFMSNHVSNLDPPVLLPSIPGQAAVLLKAELMKIPIVGTAMRLAKFVPVERGGRRDAAATSVRAAAEALGAGLHILVFAEGTRSLDGRLSTFKKGPFFLAQQTGAWIVPMAITGTETMMRKGSSAITPGVARVQMLPAMDPKAYSTREQLMVAVHGAIAAALPEQMRPLAEPAAGA